MSRWSLLFLVGCTLHLDDLDGDGFVAENADCDDLDGGVHPDGTEVIGDGIDQDCDGADRTAAVFGESHSCAIDSGAILCVGDDTYGQLEAPDGSRWTTLAAGALHTCALDEDGAIACWGDNRYGQSDPPAIRVSWLEASDWATVAERDGTLLCWGLCQIQR